MITFSAILIHLYPTPAQATTYYVAPTGNDSNLCSQSQPCLTIGHGLSVAAGPGNALYVASGTYTENPNLTTGGSPSGGNFVVQGFAPGSSCSETASSDPFTPEGTNPAPTAKIVGQVQINASYVTFTCFDVTPNFALGRNYNYNSFTPQDAGIGVSTSSLTTITISENYVHKNTGGSGGGFGAIDPSGSGYYVFDYAIAAGCAGCRYALSNISVIHNFMRMGGGQIASMSCSGTCLFQDNEEYGGEADDNNFADGHDLDYNELENTSGVGGGVLSVLGNYMHGADQNFCGTSRHNCHTDCFEDGNWGAQNIVIDRNVCFNWNEGWYFWDCVNSACNTSDANRAHGTYTQIYNDVATNNIFAFGANEQADVCLDIWHGQFRFDNNSCWGAFSEASLNSDVLSYENNINVATYNGPGGVSQCTTPYGIDLEGGFSPEGTTFDVTNANIDWQDTTCTVPNSGLYVNDKRNVDPKWVSPGSYSNTPVASASGKDFHLQSSSPAIGAGSNLCGLFTDDLAGNTRPCGAFDIGPYMLLNASGPFPPTNLAVLAN